MFDNSWLHLFYGKVSGTALRLGYYNILPDLDYYKNFKALPWFRIKKQDSSNYIIKLWFKISCPIPCKQALSQYLDIIPDIPLEIKSQNIPLKFEILFIGWHCQLFHK